MSCVLGPGIPDPGSWILGPRVWGPESLVLSPGSSFYKISVRLTRFRRSYKNRPAVFLTKHLSSTTFLLDLHCAVQSAPIPFFWQLFVPNASAFM